jgi:integrase
MVHDLVQRGADISHAGTAALGKIDPIMASVFNRGTKHRPLWYVKYKEGGAWKMVPSHLRTKQKARRFAELAEERVANGLVGVPNVDEDALASKRMTVGDLGKRFVAEYTGGRVKNVKKYRREVGYLLGKHVWPKEPKLGRGWLGRMKVGQVGRSDLRRFRDELLEDGLSNSTVKIALANLSRMFNWAREEGIIDCANPVALVEKPSVAGQADDFDFLSADEVHALLAWASVNQPTEYPLYATAVYGGMRMGELFGLRWTDVSLERELISVRRSYLSTPKSGKPRHVPINPRLLPILADWKARAVPSADGLVFPTSAGKMRSKDSEYGYAAALAGAKCHDLNFHALRHTFASHFVMSGGNILTLQKLLGHSSVAVTMKYAHLAPDFMKEEVARMAFAVRAETEKTAAA